MPSLCPVDLKRDASRRCFISMLAAAGLAIAPLRTALAQAYYDGAAYFSPVVNWSGPLLAGSSMNSYIKRAKTSRTDDAGRQPSPREKQRERTERSSFAALRVSSDPRISAQVKDQFRQQLIQANAPQRAAIERALAKDWLQGYRREVAQPNGLDSQNLADSMTAYTVAAWAIVHQQMQISPRAVTSVRDTLRSNLAANPALAKMSAAERQVLSEQLIYQTVLIMANRTEIQRTGNSALAQAAASHYRQAARTGMQLDLDQLALTQQGFIER